MVDFRKIGELWKHLPPPPSDDFWTASWRQRGEAVQSVLGNTVTPGTVTSFAWRDYVLPGACALTFRIDSESTEFLFMSLGLTQPLNPTDIAYPWEFSIRASENEDWCRDLLYQLVTQWLWEDKDIRVGYSLPIVFLREAEGLLVARVTDCFDGLEVVGDIRRLYLWSDEKRIRFKATTGEFGLLAVVGVTEDEDEIANETTPAHLMLLFRRMGVRQLFDPTRRSVLLQAGVSAQWNSIKGLTHEDVLTAIRQKS